MFVLLSGLVLISQQSFAQNVIATVPVGAGPIASAINPVTDKIYVANTVSNDVTVIDGSNFSTVTVAAPNGPTAPQSVAVNPVTNKIYVASVNGNFVTVIDGATNSTTAVTTGTYARCVAVNTVTNKIYVTNYGDNTTSVIDGATLSTTTIPVGIGPEGVVVDTVRNKIYVSNVFGNSVTVINGRTLTTQTVAVGALPRQLAVDMVTNKIYTANQSDGTVTAIDGATLAASTVTVGALPRSIAVNSITGNVYVACQQSNEVVVIKEADLSTVTVPVGSNPIAVAVDPTTNEIYVANVVDQTITIIDGASNATSSVAVGSGPSAVSVNQSDHQIYVSNTNDNTVSVVAGIGPSPLRFIPVTPCRSVDTRPQHGGKGPIQGNTSQSFVIPGTCGIPTTAAAYSLNITVVPHGSLGYLTVWPTGLAQPLVSTLNSVDGRVKADAAIVPAGANGAISIFANMSIGAPAASTDVIVDINGYFVPASDTNALAFYPLTPCRVVDTRLATGPLGGPNLTANQTRDFPLLSSTNCNIPPAAQAYSVNFTVVPTKALGYLTAWPADQAQPVVSTLNDPTGTIVANAAIVPAAQTSGSGYSIGDIKVFVTDATAVIIDINGYFAPPATDGLSLYTAAPCRVLDTRKGNGAFNGTLMPPVNVVGSPCGVPNTAAAFVFNATAVPPGPLGYLTLWPDGQAQPLVSTLNAFDGYITNNMAIVPTNNGSIDAFANGTTQLILDLFGYFAP